MFYARSWGQGPPEARNVTIEFDVSNIKRCRRCGQRYDWRKSPSASLKMTYCGSLCERADLGFTLEALLRFEPDRRLLEEPAARS